MQATAFTIKGRVTDRSTGEPIEFAAVTARPSGAATMTGADGSFSLSVSDSSVTITASMVGYKPLTESLILKGSDTQRQITISLQRIGHAFNEVVVTARESAGITSASRIDRDAMAHLPPTSFTDLLELLPGNMSTTPTMGSVNSIALRETGTISAGGAKYTDDDYNISSLGTLFVVDGAPVSGDANMQNVGGGTSSYGVSSKDMTNRGVDMRSISTDNIESVEIVRGIPSAEYGNLTSGMVNIKRIRRATPLQARLKVDEYSKLASVGKGIAVGNGNSDILNLDISYLDSKVDPRDNLENYKRITASARFHSSRQLSNGGELKFSPSADYTGTFDKSKHDPDLAYGSIDEYRADYNRYSAAAMLEWLTGRTAVSSLSLNVSGSLQSDQLDRRRTVSPLRASIAPTTMAPGVHDGQYLLSGYVASYHSDGRPLHLFAKLRATGSLRWKGLQANHLAGIEWTLDKNLGRGQVYDLTRPLSAGWTTRPRAYRDIPALNNLSAYAEENATVTAGSSSVNISAGVRMSALPGIGRRYLLGRRVYIDPRINAKWNFPSIATSRGQLHTSIAAGWGLTTRMPTIDYLFPQAAYNDFIQLNYYDINRPHEFSRVNLRTYIDDAVNYDLRAARNRKMELRFMASIGANRLSVTYFQEKMNDGFRYSPQYGVYEYRRYDASAIDPSQLTAPPTIDNLPYTDMTILDGYRMATNGSRIDKKGVEFQINTARWNALRTSLTVTGAWFHTRYSNSQMLYRAVSTVHDNIPVSNRYVGLYDTSDGRVNDQFNTNFMFDTQITRLGLILTTSIQCMWWVDTTRLRENGTPTAYLSAEDGALHPYTPEAVEAEPMLRYLTQVYTQAMFDKYHTPMAIYVNLKAAKQIGRYARISVYVNRMFDYLPDYKSNGIVIRRTAEPYFGMELNFTI
ncbi:MAG: TonB-dependent receptor [Muribaculaceae bacterium]|nr:TonB-dependent receptor [Muribaculaceae bacterium]